MPLPISPQEQSPSRRTEFQEEGDEGREAALLPNECWDDI